MEKLKIMVVDDEPRMRKLVKAYLEKNDYEVIEAGDGEEAEEAGDELPPPATYLIAYTIKADG